MPKFNFNTHTLALALIFLICNVSVAQEINFIPCSNLDFDTRFDYSKSSKTEKTFWNAIKLNNVHYRCEFESKKSKKQQIYSVDLRKIDTSSVSYKSIGNSINLIDKDATVNNGSFILLSKEDCFAVIKSGQFGSSGRLFDGEGLDIHVFDSKNLNLIYKQSISLSNKEQSGKILKMELDNLGNLFVLSSLKYVKDNLNSKDNPEGDLTLTRISNSEIINERISSKNILSGHFTHIGGTVSHLSLFGLTDDKTKFVVSVVSTSAEMNEVYDEKKISIKEIISVNNANYNKNFLKQAEKSTELPVTLEPLKTFINHFTFESGSTIISYPISIDLPRGSGLKYLHCSLVFMIDKNGQIKWSQSIPIDQSYLTLLDSNNNIHIFGNGILKEYDNEEYVGDQEHEVFPKFVSVEIVLDGDTGEISSNRIFSSEHIPISYEFDSYTGYTFNVSDNKGCAKFWDSRKDESINGYMIISE